MSRDLDTTRPERAILSVIVPLFDEEDNVVALYGKIRNAVDSLDIPYEIIFVDDGSQDDTYRRASKLAASDSHLRVIGFTRNYGQTPAMVAGITHAVGDILITMDGDLQNDPKDIPRFLEKMDEGYDIVVGWRHNRHDKLFERKIPSMIANKIIASITGVPIKDNGCSLKAYRSQIIKNIPLYSEMHRFIPAMASLAGTKIAEIKVAHHPRTAGKSKYSLSRVYKVMLDLITIKTLLSLMPRPLAGFALGSGIAAVVSAITLAIGIVQWLLQPQQVSIVFFGLGILYGALAILLLIWGILAELIYRTGDVKLEAFAKLKTTESS